MTRSTGNLDANHHEIANAFRGLGCSVQSLADVGKGCPDLLVGIDCGNLRVNLLVEVKAFPAGTLKGELNDDQTRWHEGWRGQVAVVRSLEDVGRLVKAAKEAGWLSESKA